MEAQNCNNCGAVRDLADNFCRRCGRELALSLPAVREPMLPARSRAIPPSLMGSIAVLALGTGIEWLARRAAGTAARAAGRALIGADRAPVRGRRAATPEAVEIDEVLYVRKVQLRR